LGIGHWALGKRRQEAEVLKCLNFVSAAFFEPGSVILNC
jgi:hypothetical protein